LGFAGEERFDERVSIAEATRVDVLAATESALRAYVATGELPPLPMEANETG
jgi:hypothetical protein